MVTALDVRSARVQRILTALLLVALAAVLAWSAAHPRRPFEYMAVGAFATALCLILAYLAAVKRKLLPGFTFRIVSRARTFERASEARPRP